MKTKVKQNYFCLQTVISIRKIESYRFKLVILLNHEGCHFSFEPKVIFYLSFFQFMLDFRG